MKQQKWLQMACALAMAATVSFAMPLPTEAISLGSILGGVSDIANEAKAYKEMNQKIHYYDETEEGRQELLQKFKDRTGEVYNPERKAQLDDIMAHLTEGIAATDPSIYDKPYLYYLTPDPTFNAACSYGHVMYVNIGTFSLTDNMDELAVVLGHEMGHGQKSHVAHALKKRSMTALGAAIIAGSLSGDALKENLLSIAVNQIDTVQISRKDEWEADNLSFDYIYHGGYNPGATAAIWQRVIDMQGDNSSNFVGEIFSPSDHPSNMQRRDNYEKKISELSGKHVTIKKGTDTVQINGKDFVTPAAAAGMTQAERKYFVMGNLAAAYDHKQNKETAVNDNGTVKLGNQAIITPMNGDPSADDLAALLNKIK